MERDLGIYVHVPFCVRKCLYCDFLSFGGTGREVWERYVDGVCEEIRAWGRALGCSLEEEKRKKEEDGKGERGSGRIREGIRYRVRSVFFGGGTPSLFDGDLLANMMETLREVFEVAEDAEISVECNPGTVSREKFEWYRSCGVNRISFGVQSADDELLRRLGRIHSWGEFLTNFKAAREAGFSNINVDLMSGLPGQSLADWKDTLEKVVALGPEHVSAYSLIIEEGTPFFEWYGENEGSGRPEPREKEEKNGIDGDVHPQLPDEDTEREMYEWTGRFLAEKGLDRYEISNYAKPGFACRHNVSYWKRTEYLGIGLGASSLFEGRRWHNTTVLEEYLENAGSLEKLRRDEAVLSKKDAMEEFMFLGLRMCEGVKRTDFEREFGSSMEQIYGEVISRLVTNGLLRETEEGVALTERGIDVSNPVLAEFLLEG
ncbi:MAG: radical SAM family heme chaperone HemW [Lachnospiraceae bacterium]|nr:radical SAM family heme chaperone HemW [Lachnospiraceae bacterium]